MEKLLGAEDTKHQKDKEEVKAYQRAYQESHKEELALYAREYRATTLKAYKQVHHMKKRIKNTKRKIKELKLQLIEEKKSLKELEEPDSDSE
jgi:hypothetical protein